MCVYIRLRCSTKHISLEKHNSAHCRDARHRRVRIVNLRTENSQAIESNAKRCGVLCCFPPVTFCCFAFGHRNLTVSLNSAFQSIYNGQFHFSIFQLLTRSINFSRFAQSQFAMAEFFLLRISTFGHRSLTELSIYASGSINIDLNNFHYFLC